MGRSPCIFAAQQESRAQVGQKARHGSKSEQSVPGGIHGHARQTIRARDLSVFYHFTDEYTGIIPR